MSSSLFTDDSLVSILVPFVGKVEARIEALLTRDVAMPDALTTDKPTPELPDALLDGFCSDLVQLIQRTREFAVVSKRDISPEMISEFTYLLTAFVDEMLISTLNTQLPQRFIGTVEHLVFGTRNAGEQVFMRIERLLARRSQLDVGLAGAYLLLLSLGFKGQYFQQGRSEILAQYHRDLSSLALRLSTDSVRHPMPPDGSNASGAMVGMAMHRRLSFLWCTIVLTWLTAVISLEILWRKETAPVRKAVADLHAPMSPTHPRGMIDE